MLTPSAVDVDDSTSKDVTENENVDEDGDNTAEADVDVNFVTGAVAFSFDTGGVDGAEGGSDADDTDNSPAVMMLKDKRGVVDGVLDFKSVLHRSVEDIRLEEKALELCVRLLGRLKRRFRPAVDGVPTSWSRPSSIGRDGTEDCDLYTWR